MSEPFATEAAEMLYVLRQATLHEYGWFHVGHRLVHCTDVSRQCRLPPRGIDRRLYRSRSTYKGIARQDDLSTFDWE